MLGRQHLCVAVFDSPRERKREGSLNLNKQRSPVKHMSKILDAFSQIYMGFVRKEERLALLFLCKAFPVHVASSMSETGC